MTSLFEQESARWAVLPLDFMELGNRDIASLEFGPAQRTAFDKVDEAPAETQCDMLPVSSNEHSPEQVSRLMEQARYEAAQDTTLSLESDFQSRLKEEREKVAKMYVDFMRDRQRYFAAAESEVARLALAIAERVLSHEVAADPLHLAATIRSALSKIRDGSQTRLRVQAHESSAWMQLFADEPQLEVVIDAGLASGECILETKVGQVSLGVRSQLEEIERHFSEWTGVASTGEVPPC